VASIQAGPTRAAFNARCVALGLVASIQAGPTQATFNARTSRPDASDARLVGRRASWRASRPDSSDVGLVVSV